VTGFSAKWLALRADADLRARNTALAARLATHFAGRTGLRILDLGAGSGNNLRATAPGLPKPQTWILADADTNLLQHAAASSPAGSTAELEPIDLSKGTMALISRTRPDLVTASAFLDLCGRAWIEGLAEALATAGSALYAVLSYDGREAWEPASPLDDAALSAFHADQRRDKGLGPALGPDAHAYLAACLTRRGFSVVEGRSDWDLIHPRDAALIDALAQGSAQAISGHLGTDTAAAWLAQRRNAAHVMVGHRDLLAIAPQ